MGLVSFAKATNSTSSQGAEKMKRPMTFFVLAFAAILLAATAIGESTPAESGDSMALADTGDSFQPVAFPDDLGIPGFSFPEPAATIIGWTHNDDQASIAKHGWGIWVGLNTLSDQTFEGQTLRVFETWYTPTDIQCIAGLLPASNKSCTGVEDGSRDPRPLDTLHQLSGDQASEGTVVGFVKYDPTAAEHTLQQELFNAKVLQQLLAYGETGVPDFPSTAIATKPVFTTLCFGAECQSFDGPVMASQDGRYYQIRVWPGSAADPGFPTQPDKNGFGYGPQWPNCVWIDTRNESSPASQAIDEGCGDTVVTPYIRCALRWKNRTGLEGQIVRRLTKQDL